MNPHPSEHKRPNILLILTDQQSMDTISALGCGHVRTPGMDRLVQEGTSFTESHCTNPVCCPARSSIFTGRMPCETGVITNEIPIRPHMPNLGQWLGGRGYRSVYAGKWHLHGGPEWREIPGFEVLPGGLYGQGTLMDPVVSASCENFLHGYDGDEPFFLVAGLMQPHDVCMWVFMNSDRPDVLPYPELADELPPLPDNFQYDPKEPESLSDKRRKFRPDWSDQQWRYYIWSYLRMVEEADAEVLRILDALRETGHDEDTLVVFTSDHGEGMGKHQMVLKSYLYDDVVKVPLAMRLPGRIRKGQIDREHLVSGVDIAPTLCDYADVEPPPDCRGLSLRPALEGESMQGHDYVVSETSSSTARMVRTRQYKYVQYEQDDTRQLFDMRADPLETRNLIDEPDLQDVAIRHEQLARQWKEAMIWDPDPMARSMRRK
jgi:arylsulfatase A-like enzyme